MSAAIATGPRLPRIPVGFFGIVLGLLGLGLAWRTAARVWPVPEMVGEAILLVGTILWAMLLALYAGKWVVAQAEVVGEATHPILCCFLSLIPITTLLEALVVRPYAEPLSWVLFVVGVVGTLGFAVYRTGRLWQGGGDTGGITAVLYLPTVAGSFVIATAASGFGLREWGGLAFGIGLFSWLSLESVLFFRLLAGPVLPAPLRPTMGIQLAPPAVGVLAYLNIGSGETDLVVKAMVGYALLQAMLAARMLPWTMAQPFAPAYWAFSFGPAALAGAAIRVAANSPGSPIALLAPFILGAATLLIATLVVGSVRLLIAGRLLPVAR